MPPTFLTINTDLVEVQLMHRDQRLVEQIKAIAQPNELPKLVFIAIDNDLLNKVEFIKKLVLKKGFIPIIGESALGTYLVTQHYGKKEPILRDCLSLIDLCDEFWLVFDGLSPSLEQNIAEGVLFELRYWQKMHPGAAITAYHLMSSSPFLQEVDQFSENCPLLTQSQSFIDDVERALQRQIPQKLKSRFIAIAVQDAKHVDWLRVAALEDQRVPVCPYNLISLGTLLNACEDLSELQLIKYYASIALKCEETYVYASLVATHVTQDKLDTQVLFILFLMNRLKHLQKSTVYYQSFAELNIPKYRSPHVWSVTQEEANHTQEEERALTATAFRFFSTSTPSAKALPPMNSSLTPNE